MSSIVNREGLQLTVRQVVKDSLTSVVVSNVRKHCALKSSNYAPREYYLPTALLKCLYLPRLPNHLLVTIHATTTPEKYSPQFYTLMVFCQYGDRHPLRIDSGSTSSIQWPTIH